MTCQPAAGWPFSSKPLEGASIKAWATIARLSVGAAQPRVDSHHNVAAPPPVEASLIHLTYKC